MVCAIFRRVMVILDVKILAAGTEVGFKIGNPKPITEAENSGPKQPSSSGPVQQKRKYKSCKGNKEMLQMSFRLSQKFHSR